MHVEATNHPVSAQAANALAMHLRGNPDDALRDPSDLAAQFGLSVGFVQDVLKSIGEAAAAQPAEKLHVNLSFVGRAWSWLSSFFDGVTSRPVVFILTTLYAAIAAAYAISYVYRPHVVGGLMSLVRPENLAIVAVGLFTFALHMACYYKNRMGRYALYGGLAVWLNVTVLSAATADWTRGNESVLANLFAMAFAMMMLSLIYTGFGALSALMGAWIKVRRQRRQDENMTRQEMLERYFELQARLQAGPNQQTAPESVLNTRGARLFARYGWIAITSVSLVLHTLLVMVMITGVLEAPTRSNLVFVFGILQVVFILCHIGIGFFSRALPWAMANSLLFTAVGLAPSWFASKVLHQSTAESNLDLWDFIFNGVVFVGVAVAGGLGATVQRRADRDWSLQQNDPASILAEIVRLQWRLGDRATEVCVMVVDAAKSAEMKASADPLDVEYSFREYQDWIATVSAQSEGKVHSTAGDGAVVSFPTPAQAFLAARRLQTDITRFNREGNRLSSPFRLRIGLHLGSITGDLDKIQFAEVIDIAAHVQGVAPISGIVVTSEVAAQLPDDMFVPLANPVDDHPVLLALNPTVDE